MNNDEIKKALELLKEANDMFLNPKNGTYGKVGSRIYLFLDSLEKQKEMECFDSQNTSYCHSCKDMNYYVGYTEEKDMKQKYDRKMSANEVIEVAQKLNSEQELQIKSDAHLINELTEKLSEVVNVLSYICESRGELDKLNCKLRRMISKIKSK